MDVALGWVDGLRFDVRVDEAKSGDVPETEAGKSLETLVPGRALGTQPASSTSGLHASREKRWNNAGAILNMV